jgi:hypothetical protein
LVKAKVMARVMGKAGAMAKLFVQRRQVQEAEAGEQRTPQAAGKRRRKTSEDVAIVRAIERSRALKSHSVKEFATSATQSIFAALAEDLLTFAFCSVG